MKSFFTFILFIFTMSSFSFGQTKQFRSNLYIVDPTGNPVLMDGTLTMFHNDFSNEVNNQDARKMFNPSENIGMERGGKVLIVERRQDINGPDTIFYKLWNTRIITYRLEFTSKYLDGQSIVPVLFDKYLNISTVLSTTENNYYDFEVTADANSKRADRFMVVFNPMAEKGLLPLNFISSSVSSINNGVSIVWETANENNVKDFTIERSDDGVQFTNSGIITDANNEASNNYRAYDYSLTTGNYYYRIRATDLDGKITFSKIMKIAGINTNATISVYPNPAKASNIQVKFSGQKKGAYRISVISGFGSIVHSQTEILTDNPAQIKLNNRQSLPHGIYRIEVSGPEGYRHTLNLLISQ